MLSLPIYTANQLVQLQFPLTKTCYFHYHNFGTLIISRFDEFPHEVVIMLFFSIAAAAAAVLLHKRKKKEEGFKSANITSLRFSFQGFVVLARRDMDKSTSLRGELVWFGLHNVILPSNPTFWGCKGCDPFKCSGFRSTKFAYCESRAQILQKRLLQRQMWRKGHRRPKKAVVAADWAKWYG